MRGPLGAPRKPNIFWPLQGFLCRKQKKHTNHNNKCAGEKLPWLIAFAVLRLTQGALRSQLITKVINGQVQSIPGRRQLRTSRCIMVGESDHEQHTRRKEDLRHTKNSKNAGHSFADQLVSFSTLSGNLLQSMKILLALLWLSAICVAFPFSPLYGGNLSHFDYHDYQ